MAYKYAYEIPHLAVGKILPNGYTVTAYAVSDRHAVILAAISTGEQGNLKVGFTTWTASNNDLRSTANGHYFTTMETSFADFKKRVAEMYQLS